MGHKGPRRGSLAYWHRSRAGRMVPRVRSWTRASPAAGMAGFPGYKAGMERLLVVDDEGSATNGQQVIWPGTVVEVPPVFVYGITGYSRTPIGLKKIAEVVSPTAPKQLKRAAVPAKKPKKGVEALAGAEDVRLLVCTQPWKAGIGKHTPEVVEVALQGDVEKAIEYAKSVLGKEVKVSDVIKQGDYLDVIAVTTGRGWQGVVKRHGVSLNPHKATKSRRHGGTIGAERQGKVMYTVPRAGQHGFHRRTDTNKRVLAVGTAGGQGALIAGVFHCYGPVKGDFVVVKGSVPGPSKRFVTLRRTARDAKAPQVIKLV